MKNAHTYINKWFPVDSLETRENKYKAYVIIYFTLLTLVFLVLFSVLNIFVPIHHAGVLWLDCIVVILYIYTLRYKIDLVFIGNLMALGAFILQIIGTMNSGGVYFLGLVWAIVIPMIAFCFANLKSGFFWTGVIVIYGFILHFLEINAMENFRIPFQNPHFYFIVTTLFFVFIGVFLAIFKRGNDLIIEELKEQKKLLWEQEQETLKKAKMLQEAQDALLEKNKVLEEAKCILSTQNQALEESKTTLFTQNQDLEEAKYALSAQNKELEQFAYATSHDLKQPLRTIKSFSKILKNHLNHKSWMDQDTEEYIDFIVKGSDNMNLFITDLLKYACVANDSATYIENDLNDVLASVEESLFESIQSTQTTIIYDDLPSLPIVPVKINQLFQNLISNAIKFRKKEEHLVLKIAVKEFYNHWEFMIEDNGIGINESDAKVIFQPFRKLHNKEEYSGSGIGLATCRKIVEMHKGKIWVESTLGRGTCFYFTLPKKTKEVSDLKKINPPMMRVV